MCSGPPRPLLLASPSGAVCPGLELNIHLAASSANRLIRNLGLNQIPSSNTAITKDTAAEQTE